MLVGFFFVFRISINLMKSQMQGDMEDKRENDNEERDVDSPLIQKKDASTL